MQRRKSYVRRLEESAWAVSLTCLALGLFAGICIAGLVRWGDGAWCR